MFDNLLKPNSKKATKLLGAVKTFGVALTGLAMLNNHPNVISLIWISVYAIDFVVSIISEEPR